MVALSQAGDDGACELAGRRRSGVLTATLALTRSQALRLIQAENFARQVLLIPR